MEHVKGVRLARRLPGDIPPLFSALRLLGLQDAELARLIEVSPPTVLKWTAGLKPIPKPHQVALIVLGLYLSDAIVERQPQGSVGARRAAILWAAARDLLALAWAELRATCGGEIPDDVIKLGAEGGELMIAAVVLDQRTKELDRREIALRAEIEALEKRLRS
jgi:hypothetical protein